MTKNILQLLVVLLITVQGVMGQTVSVVSLSNAAPGDIEVQVDMDGFTDVGAITLYIEYDSELLDFTGITNTTLAGTWVANDATTDLVIVTYMTDGSSNSPSGKLFDLQFYNYGGFSSDITFDESNCEIVDQGLSTITTTYTNGTVTQGASVGTVTLGTDTDISQGATAEVPVTFEGTGFGTVNGFTLLISYDDAALLYTGLANNTLTGVVASASNGIITITWNSATSEDFTSSTDVFDLQFTYNGVGGEIVAFQPGCEVTSGTTPLAVSYSNGLVTPLASGWSATIEDAAATSDSADVTQTISIDGFGSGFLLGAITLNIGYNSHLTYKGYTAVQGTGWVVTNNTGNEITFSYAGNLTAVDGDLLTIDWTYDYDGGGNADVVFMPGCEFADQNLDLGSIIYNDGFVAQAYEVSGQLTYMGDGTRPIGTSGSSATTVYLKNVADSTVAYTAATDASGNYSFTEVFAGSYFLDASTTIDAQYSYDLTDAFIIYGIGGTLTGLQYLAADVNEADGVDVTDAFIVYGSYIAGNIKVGAWTAPDWFFENTVVNVTTDTPGQDFQGIAGGDANGDWVPVP